MKKQINPSIKAHLLRSALILLSLLAICAIPFTLAQRNAAIPAARIYPPQNASPSTSAAIAHQPSYQGDITSRSDVPFLKPQAALVPERPAVCTLNGTLGTAPPGGATGTIATRLSRPGSPTVICGVPPAFPGNTDTGPFIYNVHYITNTGGSPLCTAVILHVVTEGIAGTNMQCSAFMAPFQAGDITNPTRYLGDAGVSTGNPPVNTVFQLTVPAFTTIALVVFNVNVSPAGQGTIYQLISDQDIFCQQGSPTPTATGTPSPSGTPSPTPSPTCTPLTSPTPGACTTYEAESCNNTLTGSAFVLNCPTCSGGEKVGYVGSNSGTLQFNIIAVVPGNYTMTICYLNGDATRYAYLSVNGGAGTSVSFPSTGSFQTVGSIQRTVTLNTGSNTLKFYNPIVGNWAPDFDRIQFNCAPSYLGNISTRSFVQTGDNVMIGGFVVQGTTSFKRVIIRAIGPELAQHGVPNPMADPTLELHNANGALIASNDNWQTTIIGGIITSDQRQQIQNSGLAPGDPLESAIIADLPPGNYTAIVRGVNNTTGVALVEAYDLNPETDCSPATFPILGNISTRSFVQTGDNVMIGGFIVQGARSKRLIVRAIGPELSQYGVPNPLADGSGALIASNDNWQQTIIGGIITSDQVQAIQNSGYAPGDPRESAIIANLPPGNYTAIVRGVNNTTGVALVEVYDLQ